MCGKEKKERDTFHNVCTRHIRHHVQLFSSSSSLIGAHTTRPNTKKKIKRASPCDFPYLHLPKTEGRRGKDWINVSMEEEAEAEEEEAAAADRPTDRPAPPPPQFWHASLAGGGGGN